MFPLIFIQNILSIFFKHCAQIGQNIIETRLQNICKMGDLKLFSINSLNNNVSSHQSLHKILESQFYFGEKLDTLISVGSKMIRQDYFQKISCIKYVFKNILLPRYSRSSYFQNIFKHVACKRWIDFVS